MIRLYKNVELTKNDTIKFKTRAEQSAYFNSTERYFGDVGGVIEIIASSIPVDEYNYYDLQLVSYASTEREIDGNNKTFYYFVSAVEYRTDGLTYLHLELDTIQTYMFDMEIIDTITIREHQDRRNPDGTPIWNLEPEPLNVNEWEYLEGHLRPQATNRIINGVYPVMLSVIPSAKNAEATEFGSVGSYAINYLSFIHYTANGWDSPDVYLELKGQKLKFPNINFLVEAVATVNGEVIDFTVLPF